MASELPSNSLVKLHSLALLTAGYGTLLAALAQWGLSHSAVSDPVRFAGFLVAAALAGFLQIRLRGLATRLSVRFFVLLIGLTMLSWPEVAVIACLSAIVESLLWTRPRPDCDDYRTLWRRRGAGCVCRLPGLSHSRHGILAVADGSGRNRLFRRRSVLRS